MEIMTNSLIQAELDVKQPVVVGVSGGIDSMVLLHMLAQLQISVIAVYINHQKRPQQIPLEQALIAEQCAVYGYTFIDIALGTVPENENFHDYAHHFRYQRFTAIAKEYLAQAVLTAHHADDQIETVLMKMIRGTSISGFTAIQAQSMYAGVIILRPLLDMKKDEIKAYAQQHKVLFIEDASNDSDLYLRNRIRHYVVPALMNENEQSYKHMNQLLEAISEQNEYVAQITEAFIEEHVNIYNGEKSFSLSSYLKQPKLIQKQIINHILSEMSAIEITAKKIHSVVHWLQSSNKVNSVFYIAQKALIIREYDIIKFAYALAISPLDKVQLNAGMQFVNDFEIVLNETAQIDIPKGYYIDEGKVKLPLYSRAMLAGDRIVLEQIGTKKVSRIFIDNKVPKAERSQIPIIVDSDDQILMVVGHAVASIVTKVPCASAIQLIVKG